MSNNFVIGGGWSAGQFDALDDLVSYGHVIGVNDSGLLVDCHEALTMDRLWFENRWPLLRQKVAYGHHMNMWVREKCDCNVERKDPLLDDWRTFTHFNKPYPSTDPGTLHGGNSGTCAINLAFQRMQAGDNLFLIGFDMCRGPEDQPYWYKPYPWTKPEGATKKGHFDKWARDMEAFKTYAVGHHLNVYNVSMRSQIKCFPKIKFPQMMEMLNGSP